MFRVVITQCLLLFHSSSIKTTFSTLKSLVYYNPKKIYKSSNVQFGETVFLRSSKPRLKPGHIFYFLKSGGLTFECFQKTAGILKR